MNEVWEILKRSVAPLTLGWILTVWFPVPKPLRDTVNTAIEAVGNGLRAAVHTMRPASPQPRGRSVAAAR